MSHISPFSFKNHNKIAFCLLRLLSGRFSYTWFYCKTKSLQTLASFLNTTLRAVKNYWVQIDGHWPCQLPYWGLWPQIHMYLVMLGFWVRQCKIRHILIRLLGGLLWSFDPFKMGIFWILAKFWISRVIFGKIYVIERLKKWC